MNGRFLVLKDLDNIQNVHFDILDIIRVDEPSNFLDQFHQDLDNMLAAQRQVNSNSRVVLFQFDLFQFLLDLFVDGMGNGIFWQEKQ